MGLTVLADENIPGVEDSFGSFATVRQANGRTLHRRQLQGVDILLVRSVTRVDEALLGGTAVRFVGTATSGFDHIDRDYLARRDIGFAHAPGSNANSVVEYVLAAIAAVGATLERLLAGGRLGIVGYGVIGRAVAARFAALGIHSCIYDPWLDQNSIPNAAGLDAILDCDVISLHPELTTRQPWPSFHLLGRRELRQLRPGTLLINASRGSVIDNAALLAYLEAQPDVSIVLDVWEGEPVICAALLARVTLGTAHIAGYSFDGKLRATRMLAEAVCLHQRLSPAAQARSPESVPAITVPDGLSAADLPRFLLRARYDISLDDALLRETVVDARAQPLDGTAFDRLRKSYRRRRELAGSTVQGLRSPEQRAIARALGCAAVAAMRQV